jgi:hypothetical protein
MVLDLLLLLLPPPPLPQISKVDRGLVTWLHDLVL